MPVHSLQALESDLEDLNGQLCGCLQRMSGRVILRRDLCRLDVVET